MNGAGLCKGETLATDSLVKVYRGAKRAALNKLTLSITEGRVFGLLGPNGAGKTTAISVMNTFLKPTSGNVTVCGIDAVKHPRQAKRFIGYVPQDIALFTELSVRENLAFFGRIYGLKGRKLQQRINECAEFIGLEGNLDQRVFTFSGGMKRRVNIGVGLLHKPRLLFMDEPTVGIDPQSRRAILDSVKELNRNGMTVLYTTHYMEEAQELSHRVGIIDHGDLIALGTQAELTRQVGEYESLQLELGEMDDAEGLAEALRKLEGVAQANVVDHNVILVTSSTEKVLAPAVSCATDQNIKIHSVTIQEPNLEAVFLHLTGRALRD